MKKIILLIALMITSIPSMAIEYKQYYNDFKYKVEDTWNTSDKNDLYIPTITWHNRLTYDREHIDKYNERPWGIGFGISKFDENKNWNGIYLMSFKDSFNHMEPIGGYGWEKTWYYGKNKDFRLGLGYTAFITTRENWHYIPVPGALPLASIGYKNVTFQGTYIPGTYNNGNVFFAWVRIGFDK